MPSPVPLQGVTQALPSPTQILGQVGGGSSPQTSFASLVGGPMFSMLKQARAFEDVVHNYLQYGGSELTVNQVTKELELQVKTTRALYEKLVQAYNEIHKMLG